MTKYPKCVNCLKRRVRWLPRGYEDDEPQFCTARCAGEWAHLMALGGGSELSLAREYAEETP